MNVPDRLTSLGRRRGSLALMTEESKLLEGLVCEGCGALHSGGISRGLLVLEADQEFPWRLWLLSDGWTESDEDSKGPIAACERCQAIPAVRGLRWEP
jgi:hypothetical protein